MNICFVTPEFKSEKFYDGNILGGGGLASYLNNISNVLIKNNHKVNIIVFSDNQPEKLITKDGIRVFRVKHHFFFKIINRLTFGIFYGTLRRINFAFSVFRCLRKLMVEEQIDIVQYSNYYAGGLFSIPLLNLNHVTRVSSDRNTWSKFSKRTFDSFLSDALEQLQFRLCKNIFSPSEKLKKIIEKRILNNSIKIIPTPVFCNDTKEDSSFYEENLADKDYILYFGRLEIRKGVKLLIDSLPVFFNQTNGQVVLIGRDIGGDNISSFKSYAMEKYPQFKERLLIYKPLNQSKLIPVIKNSQFVVIPSLIDNMPNTLLESLYFGKTAIVISNSGNEEVIKNGYNGYIVENDTSDLCNKMIELYNDNTVLKKMSNNAKVSSEIYSPNFIYEKTIQYYKSVIK